MTQNSASLRATLASAGSTLAFGIATMIGSVALAVTVVPRIAARLEPPPSPMIVTDWTRYAEGGQQLGLTEPSVSAVTIVQFSDFQCPYCRTLAADLRGLQETYGARVRMIYRHFPLQKIHPHAATAAMAAVCAAEQGQFNAMHDLLYDKQDSIGVLPWAVLAKSAGIADSSAFSSCLEGPAVRARVRKDIALGHALGVTATPTVLVNGLRVRGAVDRATLESFVHSELRRTVTR